MAIPDTDMWMRGVISHPWWQLEHRILDYQNEPFNDVDTLQKWRSLGFSQSKFTGDMYDMRRAEPVWINPFRQYFDLRHFSWSVAFGSGFDLPTRAHRGLRRHRRPTRSGIRRRRHLETHIGRGG